MSLLDKTYRVAHGGLAHKKQLLKQGAKFVGSELEVKENILKSLLKKGVIKEVTDETVTENPHMGAVKTFDPGSDELNPDGTQVRPAGLTDNAEIQSSFAISPAVLEGKGLNELNMMIDERNGEAQESVEEAVSVLSADFKD